MLEFLSTPSARRATFSPHDDAPRPRNFYPRPPRGGRHVAVDLFSSSVEISIHALREEGDCTAPAGISIEWDFYPRPPRGGRRPSRRDRGSIYSISIHALREEGDPGYVQGRPAAFCISIHALREEGDLWMICFCWSMEISIHALREEGDIGTSQRSAAWKYFYPRPPRGGRQSGLSMLQRTGCISIHALREEGDCKNGEKHLRFCFIIKRSAQIWKSLSKNIRKKSRDLHRTA